MINKADDNDDEIILKKQNKKRPLPTKLPNINKNIIIVPKSNHKLPDHHQISSDDKKRKPTSSKSPSKRSKVEAGNFNDVAIESSYVLTPSNNNNEQISSPLQQHNNQQRQ